MNSVLAEPRWGFVGQDAAAEYGLAPSNKPLN
jgi:hypothetical protein